MRQSARSGISLKLRRPSLLILISGHGSCRQHLPEAVGLLGLPYPNISSGRRRKFHQRELGESRGSSANINL